MEADLHNGELCLADNAPVRLSRARGVRVTCTAGRVWLTVEGETGDIFLRPGESHVIATDGLALLEALGDGRVRLGRPARTGFRFRLSALSRGFPRPAPPAPLSMAI